MSRLIEPSTKSAESRGLGFQATRDHPPKQGVSRIGLARFVVPNVRPSIRGRRHHQFMHRLQRPAARREFAGEPVEQFGMGRFLAHRAEVARSGDDSLAVMVLPKPVDHHSRGQRIARIDDPARERQSSSSRLASRRRRDRRQRRDDRARKTGLNFDPRLPRVASNHQVRRFGGRTFIGDGGRVRQRTWPSVVQETDLMFDRGDSSAIGRGQGLVQFGIRRFDFGFGIANQFLLVVGPSFLGRGEREQGRVVESSELAGDDRRFGRFANRGDFASMPGDLPIHTGKELVETLHFGFGDEVDFIPTARLENGEQSIVIGLGDRVEFVVVAAGAMDRHAEHRRADRLDQVVELIEPVHHFIGRLVVVKTQAMQSGGDSRFDGRAGISSPAICSRTNRS